MLNVTYILARSGEDELMKIVFGVAAVVIWGLFQLIGAIAKKAEDAKRRQQYGRLPEDVARGGGTPLPVPAPPPVPWGQKQTKGRGNKKASKRAPLVAPAPPPAVQPVPAIASGVREAAASRPQARAAGAPAGQIARLLRRPESLRAAVVLSEVMSKPVALRETGRE
jgi:hypothetical protein